MICKNSDYPQNKQSLPHIFLGAYLGSDSTVGSFLGLKSMYSGLKGFITKKTGPK